jgi:hypothetical protein
MRRAIATILVGATLIVTAALSGCPAAHDGYPGASCTVDSDCYQGEICQDHTMCVPNLDMSVVSDFAHPGFDLSNADLNGDLLPIPDDLTPVDL